MVSFGAVIFSVLLGVSLAARTFPPGFKFGTATSSFQVEGAWNVSDKSISNWDVFSNLPGKITEGATAEVASDSYHLYKRDVELLKELGVDFYRFSISWPRLLPTGFSNKISEDGTNYYNNLINELIANGIEPVATIYHWDMPQSLQDLGGWTNPLITDWFADYSRVVFSLFGDRVKTWITINEPVIVCDIPYNSGVWGVAFTSPEVGTYLCTKNVLIAHAKAWRIYDEEFRAQQKGIISLCNHYIWFEPATEEDREVTELVRATSVGRYTHPILSKEGGWPPLLEEYMAKKSKEEGYNWNRLPAFTQEEIELVRGTYDYLGFNHYTSRLVRRAAPGETVQPFPMLGAPDFGAVFEKHPAWGNTASWWFYVHPEGIRKHLVYLKELYGDVPILITENGFATSRFDDLEKELDDNGRVAYFRDYLEQVWLAIHEDGVNVSGYTAWTLIDNFEWGDGYSSKFGLYHVDFNHAERTRTARKSAKYYASVVKSRSLDVPDLSKEKIEL